MELLLGGLEGLWALPTSLSVDTAETAADITPEVPTSVIYADHSRPCGAATSIRRVHGPAERADQADAAGRIPLEWSFFLADLKVFASVTRCLSPSSPVTRARTNARIC
jgi:hypothetical protein